MRGHIAFFDTARAHYGIDQQILISKTGRNPRDPVRCRDALGISRLLPRATLRRGQQGPAQGFLEYAVFFWTQQSPGIVEVVKGKSHGDETPPLRAGFKRES